MKRRSFIKNTIMTVVGLPLIGTSVAALAKKAGITLVDPKDKTAVALKYVEDASKSKVRKDKMGVKAKDQNCTNCNFYKNETDHKGQKVGKCLMLQMKYVPAKAWCNVWTKKS